jgi:galactokinase/mevalonate kinase-like predicted kinase
MTSETIRASAPLRISFVGGGTDFPHYYERHGGAVLSATIDHAAHVSGRATGPIRQVRIRSLDLGPSRSGTTSSRARVRRRDGPPQGRDRADGGADGDRRRHRIGDAPGSGLGGSSALVRLRGRARDADGQVDAPRERSRARLSRSSARTSASRARWQDQFGGGVRGLQPSRVRGRRSDRRPLELSPEAIAELRARPDALSTPATYEPTSG